MPAEGGVAAAITGEPVGQQMRPGCDIGLEKGAEFTQEECEKSSPLRPCSTELFMRLRSARPRRGVLQPRSRGGLDNMRVSCIAPSVVTTRFARVLYEDPERPRGARSRHPAQAPRRAGGHCRCRPDARLAGRRLHHRPDDRRRRRHDDCAVKRATYTPDLLAVAKARPKYAMSAAG